MLVGSAAEGLVVWNSEPIIRIFPEFSPGSLTAYVQIYNYVAAGVLRGGGAFVSVTGATQYGA